MAKIRTKHSPQAKAKIALEALKGETTTAQLSAKYSVHPTQINAWCRQVKDGIVDIFRDKRHKNESSKDELIDELYKTVGKQKVELEWLKKNMNYTTEQKRACIDPNHPKLSITEQCHLIELPRSSYYYQPLQRIDEYTLRLMKLIDEEFTRHPFLGTRSMTKYLIEKGHNVNRKRIQNLYNLMGIEAIYPKPNLSKPDKKHKIYPYLLRGKKITSCNQVWSTDITYIRLQNGFVYLMAIIDWFSRYVLDWQISTTLEANFCVEALSRTLERFKNHCEIFNTDQGSQFTAKDFIEILLNYKIQISMDGRGRALDNIFVERLWRSVKYECIYLKEFDTVRDVRNALREYFKYYNNDRHHQSLNYATPAKVYFEGIDLC